MKKNSLKLTQLNNTELSKKEMNAVKGGDGDIYCGCGCCYANQGGSDTDQNGAANAKGGLHSPGCENKSFLPEVKVETTKLTKK